MCSLFRSHSNCNHHFSTTHTQIASLIIFMHLLIKRASFKKHNTTTSSSAAIKQHKPTDDRITVMIACCCVCRLFMAGGGVHRVGKNTHHPIYHNNKYYPFSCGNHPRGIFIEEPERKPLTLFYIFVPLHSHSDVQKIFK